MSQGNYQSTLVLHGKNAFKFPVEEVTIQEWFELFDRISEVRLMEERDLNFKKGVWTVPKGKSKTNCKITRPLAPEALKIIKWQLENFSNVADYILPSGSYKKEISTQIVS